MNNKQRRKKYKEDPKFRAQCLRATHKFSRTKKALAKNKIRSREYNAKRYGKDPIYTLRVITMARVCAAFKAQDAERLYKVEYLLGCTWKQYKRYLQKKFKRGMSWKQEDGNKFHIDHIRPISSFNLNKARDQKRAFNYQNTQPLFIGDHIKKSAQYINTLEVKCIRLKRKNKEYRKVIKEVMK